MPSDNVEDPERRLMRGVLVRRLVIGLGALALGILLFALGVVLAARSPRLLRIAIASAIFGALTMLGGFVTLRVGEIRADLSVHEADPVPLRALALGASAITLAVALIAAWPLGMYRWLASLSSPCRAAITQRDVEALGLPPFDIGHVTSGASTCSLTGLEPGGERRILFLSIDGPRSGYRFEDRARNSGAVRSELIAGVGEQALILEGGGERVVAVKAARGALYVHLSAAHFQVEHARAIALLLGSRVDLVERLARP